MLNGYWTESIKKKLKKLCITLLNTQGSTQLDVTKSFQVFELGIKKLKGQKKTKTIK